MTDIATLVSPLAPPRERVARGAAQLDETRPGWFRDVDLETLAVDDTESCVLTQLYGSFSEGVNALGLRHLCCARCESRAEGTTSDADLGFDVFYGREDARESFTVLNEAWRDEIEHRRGNAA